MPQNEKQQFVPDRSDSEDLDKVHVENEIALRRAYRLVEFMRLICQNEARIVNDQVQSSEAEVHPQNLEILLRNAFGARSNGTQRKARPHYF